MKFLVTGNATCTRRTVDSCCVLTFCTLFLISILTHLTQPKLVFNLLYNYYQRSQSNRIGRTVNDVFPSVSSSLHQSIELSTTKTKFPLFCNSSFLQKQLRLGLALIISPFLSFYLLSSFVRFFFSENLFLIISEKLYSLIGRFDLI